MSSQIALFGRRLVELAVWCEMFPNRPICEHLVEPTRALGIKERTMRKRLLAIFPQLKEFPVLYHIIFPKKPRIPI